MTALGLLGLFVLMLWVCAGGDDYDSPAARRERAERAKRARR